MTREIGFRYNLLRGGAFCAYLQADESTVPTIRMDDAAEIKTSFTAKFKPLAVDSNGGAVDINWLSDEIQPVLIINGAPHELGVFAAAKSDISERDGQTRVTVQAYDRCWRVKETRRAGLIYFASGTRYLDAIEALLLEAGVETVLATPNTDTLAEAREDWNIGESYLTVINELLAEINYKPLYFNGYGAAILEPVALPEPDNIKHVFDMADPETLVIPDISRASDYYSTPNVFIVTCANPDKSGIMTSTASNENPQSPLSVQRRGRQIVRHVQVNNIASQDALDDYAAWLRDKSMLTGESMKFPSGLRPGIGVADAVGFRDTNGDFLYIGIEHAYSMQLKVGGRMTHVMERVVYNLE